MPKTITLKQFQSATQGATQDDEQRRFVRDALHGYMDKREAIQIAYQDWQSAADAIAEVKWQAIERLPELLEQFETNATARGMEVLWARGAEEARQLILDILQQENVKSVIKSKTMTSEEIHLNAALEAHQMSVVESDLGEFIVQLNKEAPYHFVFPSMHLKRGQVKKIFEHYQGSDLPTDDPEALTLFARDVLRDMYVTADVGITGGNFGVAETGHIAITENEGNARLVCALPRIHISLMGIEKIIPRMCDLSLLQPMLGTAGAGQQITGYNSLYGGPKQENEPDGPERMIVVLLDNGRSDLLADPAQRDALRCIRCGACLNVCPIFKNIGGHAYGTTYQGPIGSVITPHYNGKKAFEHLANASSLCGACTETCPVNIDLHHHLLRIRQEAATKRPKWLEKMGMRSFSAIASKPSLYNKASKAARIAHVLSKPLHGSALDPAKAWRKQRTLPDPAKKTFQQQWQAQRNEDNNE